MEHRKSDDFIHMQEEIAGIKKDIKDLKETIGELNITFQAATAFLGVIKWLATVAVGLTGLWILLTGHYK